MAINQGIKKINENVMQTDRTLIFTDPSMPIESVPIGSFQISNKDTEPSLKYKKKDATEWSKFTPKQLFDSNTIPNHLLLDKTICSDKLIDNCINETRLIAANLIPSTKLDKDTQSLLNKIKNIGNIYISTEDPSKITSNIIKDTDIWIQI